MSRKTIRVKEELYNNLKVIQDDKQLSSLEKTIEFLVREYISGTSETELILLKTILKEVQENKEIWNVYLNNTLVAEDEYKDENEHKFIETAKLLNSEKNKKLIHKNKLNINR